MIENNHSSIPVSRLYGELVSAKAAEDADEWLGSPNWESEEVVGAVLEGLFPGDDFEFDEELVKENLDEILLLLIALRERETHGKGLMEDLSGLFDAELSPGTVYPRLHHLADEELLEMHELVRTKEYHIDDEGGVEERLESAMRQHLALGFVFKAALDRVRA